MESDKGNWSLTILYALAWLICALLVMVDIFMVRQAAVTTFSVIQARRVEASATGDKTATQYSAGYQLQAIDEAMLFGGGIVAVVLAIAIEYYFRMGQKLGKLLRRIGIVLGIEVAVAVVCLLITAFV